MQQQGSRARSTHATFSRARAREDTLFLERRPILHLTSIRHYHNTYQMQRRHHWPEGPSACTTVCRSFSAASRDATLFSQCPHKRSLPRKAIIQLARIQIEAYSSNASRGLLRKCARCALPVLSTYQIHTGSRMANIVSCIGSPPILFLLLFNRKISYGRVCMCVFMLMDSRSLLFHLISAIGVAKARSKASEEQISSSYIGCRMCQVRRSNILQ